MRFRDLLMTASRGPWRGGLLPVADTYIASGNGGDQFINAAPAGAGPYTYTFSDITIGAADSRREVIIFCATSAGTATTHTSLTANDGAITFTRIIARGTAVDTASTNFISAWRANVPTGTVLTAPILTTTASSNRCGMAVMTHGRGSETNFLSAGSGATNPPTGTLDVDASGLAIGFCTATGSDIISTWDGITTEHIDAHFAGTGSAIYRNFGQYENDAVADTAKTFSCSWYDSATGLTLTGANFRMIVLAFGAKI